MASVKESIKKPPASMYNLTNDNIEILKKSGSLHPGNHKNLRIFWPMYLESHTKNVHVFNFTLVYSPKSRQYTKLYFDNRTSPGNLKYTKANLGKKISNKRFVYIVLVIHNPLGGAHANGLLYDTKTENLERFEPHGSGAPLKYTVITAPVAKMIKDFLEANLGIKIKRFNQPKSVCPKQGWQLKEGLPRLSNSVFNKTWLINGYCAAWSLYFIILRAHNPNIPSKKLQDAVFENYETTSDYIHDFYYDFLRWKVELLKHSKSF